MNVSLLLLFASKLNGHTSLATTYTWDTTTWLMLAAHRRDFFNACTEVTAILLEYASSGMSRCVNGKLLTHWFNITFQKTLISSNTTVQTSNKSCNSIPAVNLVFCLWKMLPLQITFNKMALKSRKQMKIFSTHTKIKKQWLEMDTFTVGLNITDMYRPTMT